MRPPLVVGPAVGIEEGRVDAVRVARDAARLDAARLQFLSQDLGDRDDEGGVTKADVLGRAATASYRSRRPQ